MQDNRHVTKLMFFNYALEFLVLNSYNSGTEAQTNLCCLLTLLLRNYRKILSEKFVLDIYVYIVLVEKSRTLYAFVF